MAEDVITRREHEEFARRIDTENERQNKRISLLEESLQKTNALTVAVEKMAVSMENMLEEQKKQGERLEKLEKEPAETGKQIKNAVINSVVSTIIGAVIAALLILI